MSDRVRDAMIPEPQTLEASAHGAGGGAHLVQPDVRAVYVCDDDASSESSRARRSSARWSRPGWPRGETEIGGIAEPAHWTLDPELPLDEAFRFLEEHDAERVPVVEDGRLVGVVSRSVLQRRLAEDDPPQELDALEL